MKAQHRKELQTNVLADRVGKLLESVKAGPNKSVLLLSSAAALVIVLGLGVYYYSQFTKQKRSDLWLKVDEANTLEQLEKLANDHPNSAASRVVRFEQARQHYRLGIERLYSSVESDRSESRDHLNSARDLYDQLGKENNESKVLAQEALLGSAKTRESLGDLDGALTYYDKLAKDYPDSSPGKDAAERAQQIRNGGSQFKDFYTNLQQLADTTTKK